MSSKRSIWWQVLPLTRLGVATARTFARLGRVVRSGIASLSTHCREPSYDPLTESRCVAGADGFPGGANLPTYGDDAFFCSPSGNWQAPCSINVDDDGAKGTRCVGRSIPYSVDTTNDDYEPNFCIHFENDQTTAEGDDTPFFANSRIKAFANEDVTLSVEPCSPEDQGCGVGGHWLCRYTTLNELNVGHRLWCHNVAQDFGGADQFERDPMSLTLPDDGRMVFVELSSKFDPHCFQTYLGRYCLRYDCLPDTDPDKLVDCAGQNAPSPSSAVPYYLYGLRPRSSIRYIDDPVHYPRHNHYDVRLLNSAWQQMFEVIYRMDAAHDPTTPYNSTNATTWTYTEDMLDRELLASNEAGYPDEMNDTPIPITLKGLVSNKRTTGTVRLQTGVIRLTADAEKELGREYYRVTGDCSIALQLRVRRNDGASLPGVEWLNPDDPYDLRLDHPREKIVCVGPFGERVPRQEDDTPDVGAWIRWEGLKTSQYWSMGPDTFDPLEPAANGQTCCGFMFALDQAFFHGRTNDNTQLGTDGVFTEKPQRYSGAIQFHAPDEAVMGGCAG